MQRLELLDAPTIAAVNVYNETSFAPARSSSSSSPGRGRRRRRCKVGRGGGRLGGLDPSLTSSTSAAAKSRRRPDRQLVAVAAAGLCAGAVAAGLPAFAVDAAAERGLAATTAGVLLAEGSLIALTTRVVAGWMVDRHRGHGLSEFAAIIATAAVSFAVLALADTHALFALGIVVGMGASYGCAGVIHLATLRTSSLAPGAATATLLAAIALGNVIGPAGFGALVDQATYETAWACASGVAVLSAVAALLARSLARGTRPFAVGEF